MLTTILLTLAAVSLIMGAIEVISLIGYLRRPARRPTRFPKVSLLKPLCGADPGLQKNLESFLDQDYPNYEILLGVRDAKDGAFELARQFAKSHPDRVRLHLQQGEPGLNPKVNQLVTLAAKADGEIFVISDSNVRVPRGYLSDLVAPLEDPEVGMVTSPIGGQAGEKLGGQLDALHLNTFITPAVAGMRAALRQQLFIGKSMAMRREDVAALGGFRAFGSLLAEDHALGRAMLKAGLKAQWARLPIANHTNLTVKQFVDRYARWYLLQRKITGLGFVGQFLMFPLLLSAAAALSATGRPEVLALCAAIALTRLALDLFAVRAISHRWPTRLELALLPAKESLVFAGFAKAWFDDEVAWRGNHFRVDRGTVLRRIEEHPAREFPSFQSPRLMAG
jgi:ceramide glucosyltransferase